MMKVVIDSFDTEEQAVAFVDWLSRRSAKDSIRLLTTEGMKSVYYDGVDTNDERPDTIVINIVVDDVEDEDY